MSEVYIKEPATNGKAILRTTHGDLEVELWATECPKACRNFCQLILEGYYNGTEFHRVIKDFIIQGGDATNTGDGCESIYGQPYPDEIHPRLKFRYRGMMGIASAGRGTKTNGSQFFIVLNRAPSLDGKHTLFGKVVGQTVYNLVRMAEVEVDKRDRPLEPPRILRAELVWDPFGDLEPRRQPSPPRALGGASGGEETHRRAPIQNRKVLSFGEDDEGSDDDDDGVGAKAASASSKAKSAHDLLADPRLSKEMAYPEQKPQGKQAPKKDGEAKPDVANAARRLASTGGGKAAASSSKPPAGKRAASSSSGSASGDEDRPDWSGSEEGGGGGGITQKKADSRREAISRLKREIAAVGAEPAEEQSKKRKPGSALEELRAGYQPRAPRVRAKGKEGKRIEADAIKDVLKSFRSRIQSIAGENEPGEEEGKAEKKTKEGAASSAGSDTKPAAEDGTFAAIWAEGDEEADRDWLAGGGLKFHVTADKAFKLDRDRARETLDIFDPLAARGNAEQLADARKRVSEKLMPQRRKLAKDKRDEDDRDRRRF